MVHRPGMASRNRRCLARNFTTAVSTKNRRHRTSLWSGVERKRHRLGQVRFFQKSDTNLRLLPSVSSKNQEKVVKTEKLQQVILMLLRKSQMESFGPTYQSLAAGKPMAASDRLNKLSLFMDNQNLMRLRGRLRHADASYDFSWTSIFLMRAMNIHFSYLRTIQ